MQGFLFSRPVRVDEFLERVAEQQRAIPSQSNA
jgi:EAL domain-containing protein (putative c-di-GMP-specific phosphodiesterase class I)